MTQHYGIDTSILVRLVTGEPVQAYEAAVKHLTQMVENEGAQLMASNMVIGEAYIALQRHYGVSKLSAKSALRSVLTSGLVQPVHGQAALDALAATKGIGLLNRLTTGDYLAAALDTLTLDKKMASLPRTKQIKA